MLKKEREKRKMVKYLLLENDTTGKKRYSRFIKTNNVDFILKAAKQLDSVGGGYTIAELITTFKPKPIKSSQKPSKKGKNPRNPQNKNRPTRAKRVRAKGVGSALIYGGYKSIPQATHEKGSAFKEAQFLANKHDDEFAVYIVKTEARANA